MDRVTEDVVLLTAVGPRIHEDDLAAVAAPGRDVEVVEPAPDECRATWRRSGRSDGAIEVTLYALEQYGTHNAELPVDARPAPVRGRRDRPTPAHVRRLG